MLKNVSLFANVPAQYLEQLEKLSVTRSYPKNTILVTEGDESNHLYIIKKGKVSVFLTGDDGRQVILNFMTEGEYFGELSLLDGEPRSASVMTVSPCEFIAISRASFQDLLKNNQEFSQFMICELTKRIRALTESVRDLALLDVYGRVIHTLEKLADENNRIDNPKVTHQDIANMVGSSREMVSRIMKQLIIGEYIEQHTSFILLKKKMPKYW
ncbi:Crp/Fnr family transcriptional regulator [Teredinibacter turnerae]|uniref:Cyclic nucleotide-binding domain protein n=1 Tax=Teredinibacter turnerae (strain ATCC 39867 / T7901) TaxID=377629 RepID=C5BPM1_TERTT|nr:Crp/Fnr family transcriptional regulator [Teredinibacter turnerae]ACR13158.1 cyclic nucleotide-binding domain protein [Teredinibacter turnerae T7901]